MRSGVGGEAGEEAEGFDGLEHRHAATRQRPAAACPRDTQELGLEREIHDLRDPERRRGAVLPAAAGRDGRSCRSACNGSARPPRPSHPRDPRRHARAPARNARTSAAARPSARAASMSKMVSVPTPSVSAACATAAPAPPAPSCTARSSGTSGRKRRKLSANPHQSVLCPTLLPSRSTTVFTAPSARASGESSSSNGSTACLQGCVMLSPANPMRCGREQQLLQRLGPEAELLQVDQLVDGAQTLLGALALVQRRAARGLDAGTDQADEMGRARRGDHGGFSSRMVAACPAALPAPMN